MTLIENITCLAMIGVSCIAGTVLVRDRLLQPVPAASFQSEPLDGRTLTLAGIDSRCSQRSVLLIVSANCRFCRISAPLYRRLSELHKAHSDRFQFLVYSYDTSEEIAGFLNEHGVVADHVVMAATSHIAVRATPTVLVLDRRGRVQKSFLGVLSPQSEQKLLQLIGEGA